MSATYLVWFTDDTGAEKLSTYAYVDAPSEEHALAEVRTWGIRWATAVFAASELVAGWERAEARRFYREQRGDI